MNDERPPSEILCDQEIFQSTLDTLCQLKERALVIGKGEVPDHPNPEKAAALAAATIYKDQHDSMFGRGSMDPAQAEALRFFIDQHRTKVN